ncbi:MAG: AAC(3) family N-acetyltransferase [Gemmatimonadales bacterium]
MRRGLTREFRLIRKRLLGGTSRRTLVRQLRDLGLQNGDLVLVHSAFSRIGYLRGGPQALIAALTDVVGPGGTVMMPSFPFNDPAFRYAQRGEVFDVRTTPSKVGQVQELFRRQPGTRRSVHPTHPYCAAGPLAAELVHGHHLVTNPFGPDTPLYRFVEREGRTLLIGVGLKNCSPFRVIERPDDYPHPVFHPEMLRMRVIDEAGREHMVQTLVHSLDLAPIRSTEVFRPHLEARGMLRTGRLGEATATLMESRGLMPMMRELLAAGVTPYPTLDRS